MYDTSFIGRYSLLRRALDLIDPGMFPWLFGDVTNVAVEKKVTQGHSGTSKASGTVAAVTKFKGPQFYHAADFLENLVQFRLCYIGGRLGGGKTSLAVALARYLYDRGLVDGIFTNLPIDKRYIPVLNTVFRAAVVLDEANIWAAARGSGMKDVGYGLFARKLESWWISPCKNKVDKELRDISVKRKADLFMFNAWLYAWADEESPDNSGWFVWRNPRDTFNRYKTGFIPSDDGGIMRILKADIAARSGSTQRLVLTGEDAHMFRVSGDENA